MKKRISQSRKEIFLKPTALGTKMGDKKYTLIGRALDPAALKGFPAEAKFSLKQMSGWGTTNSIEFSELAYTIQNKSTPISDKLSLSLMNSISLLCPVGPHQDPGLASAVLRACSISKVGSVAVQCSQGHWAEYPCG